MTHWRTPKKPPLPPHVRPLNPIGLHVIMTDAGMKRRRHHRVILFTVWGIVLIGAVLLLSK